MKDDKFTINVQISGMRIPLTILRSEELVYRNAEKYVNRYLNHYQRQYNKRPSEEILILVAFQMAVMVTKQEKVEDKFPLAERIEELDKELEAILSAQ